MLLSQISPSDPVTRAALDGILETCPILADVQFYSRTGPADSVKEAPESTDTETFRGLNEDNNPTPGARNYLPYGKKIVSFDAKVDVILEDRNEDPATELAIQTRLEGRERGYVLQEAFFEGDSANESDEFDGIRNMVHASNIFTPDANVTLALGNSDAHRQAQQIAYEEFQKGVRSIKGGATHVYMNGLHKIRWLTIAKELGYYRMSKDELGNTIDMIGNVIVRDAGVKTNGTDILPNTETVNAESNTSSYFFVRWGERVDLSVLTSRGLVGRYAGQIGNFYINNVNMDAVMVRQNKHAIKQMKGWQLEVPAGG